MPYDVDVTAAFQRLRDDVFARRDYATTDSPIAVGSRIFIPTSHPRPKPATIEELLEQESEMGTHSILDMICISPKPKRKAISPFPTSLLIEYFGSETPSPSEIQDVYEYGSLGRFVTTRWQGIYIVAHFDGKPSDIFFAGCSGN